MAAKQVKLLHNTVSLCLTFITNKSVLCVNCWRDIAFCLVANGDFAGSAFRNGRRTCLPAPCPDTSNINLWNILRNNIGKDLSKVSMPVELNEPLNTLQRMCEELEYSELLDKAADTEDPFERMVSKKTQSVGLNAEMLTSHWRSCWVSTLISELSFVK